MSGQFDEQMDDEWGVDPEGPQERDLVDEREDETPTVPCSNCGRPVPDFADKCPYCGDWILQSAGASRRRSLWFILIVLAVLAAFVYWFVR